MKRRLPTILALSLTLTACSNARQPGELPHHTLATVTTTQGAALPINHGDFGSDAARHPTQANRFYAITDRGPNLDIKGRHGAGKIFPTPDYTPTIGLFEINADQRIKLIKTIPLKRPDGSKISGLPNPKHLGGTNEIPYNLNGEVIRRNPDQAYHPTANPAKFDEYGLDSEGLVALADGTFWVSDEYGPHIVHYNAEGIEIGRINPFAHDRRNRHTLPAEYANRRPNRGMEGLTITPDGKTLVGIMQSALSNPDKASHKSALTRIVTIRPDSGKVQQFIYMQERKENSNSGILALDNHRFLLIERDGKFALKQNDVMKHIYQIDLSQATDLEQLPLQGRISRSPQTGHLIDGQTLEQFSLNATAADFARLGIRPVQKQLVLDLVKENNYPHDKLEGLWLSRPDTLAVINDDDFSIWTTDGQPEVKYLDKERSRIDRNTVYRFPLKLK